MPTLLIDNYDSYTFNLYQLLAQVEGVEPVVVRNDELAWDELARQGWDRIVISPGPGRPGRERDLGICRAALSQDEIPVLGVCLGHQGLAHVRGGTVGRGEGIVHGRISPVFHRGEGLFSAIPQGFRAVRYHSLVVDPALPPSLEAIAWSDDGTVMAIRARGTLAWGVQFHPESVGTEHGERLIANFLELTPAGRSSRATPDLRTTAVPGGHAPLRSSGAVHIQHRELDLAPDAERAFSALFADCDDAFWLDSSLVDPALSRFSFMGAAQGPLGAQIRYRVREQCLTITRDGRTEQRDEPLLDYLARELARLHTATAQLPFDLNGGFVGYLGYELKADCGAADAHRAELPDAFLLLADRVVAFDHELCRTHLLALSEHDARGDELARRWLDEGAATLAALDGDQPGDPIAAGAEQISRVGAAEIPFVGVQEDPFAGAAEGPCAGAEENPCAGAEEDSLAEQRPVDFALARSREHYMANVEACKRLLEAGESYEICLTNRVGLAAPADSFALYRVLRRVNPAPYGAYLRMREGAVLSSSPERFLRVRRDRSIEAKPIKGTAARHADPHADERARGALLESAKDRAEHLMIVDLLRNDIGRVAQIGSVYVAKLMDVESYATVHQLVSTIRGLLRDDVDLADCIRATFPGGSMTGAPKLRTMEIIDDLEGAARGVYAGALGYLALNGTADLSIVIRTLVATAKGASIGTGGAIVMQSDAAQEYEEMLLKAQPLLAAASIRAAAEGQDAADRAEPATAEPASLRPRVRSR
jgi:para-aminobenzoate synthetase